VKIPILLLIVFTSNLINAEETWRFLLLADWHNAEKYTQSTNNPSWLKQAIEEDVADIKMLKDNYGGELILMPGDSNGGHWDTPKFIRSFNPQLSPKEAILAAGKLCYDGMINSFEKGGYSKLIMAVGDHEMGDNPWPENSVLAHCQPQFREAFAKSFNYKANGGSFLYDKSIGEVPSQPLGTPFEDTAYAYQHKNVLFITLDAFYQESPDKRISDEGSVTGTITGEQLEWLEKVLIAAHNDSSVKHIFVQSHLPVIYPVRKVNSSGMMMDGGIESLFWEVLRKYEVDIYFAGEVHANTVSKDPHSNVIQVVSRGNFFNNFQTIDISDDQIKIICYKQNGPSVSDNNFEQSGVLIIDKTSKKPQFTHSGVLAFLELDKPVFNFSFEKEFLCSERPITGLEFKKNQKQSQQVRGVYCDRVIPNNGSFANSYDALHHKVELVPGKHGKAGRFGKNTIMTSYGMGPLDNGKPISYSVWIKTSSKENQLIINTGSIWSKAVKGFMNLRINNGLPEVVISEDHNLLALTEKINDGNWHHLAVTMPKESCRLSEVLIYVNGKKTVTRIKKGSDITLNFTKSMRLSIGGLGYTNKAFNKLNVKAFKGLIDEVCIWTRSISAEEISQLAK
jgi:hypothetical protein